MIMWVMYWVAMEVCLTGNTKSAADRNLASKGDTEGSLECTDVNYAYDDFMTFGLAPLLVILLVCSLLIIDGVMSVRYESYGTIGYVVEFFRCRSSRRHRLLSRSIVVVAFLVCTWGSIMAIDQGASPGNFLPPLIMGLLVTTVASWELFDDVPYVLTCSTVRAKAVPIKMNMLSDVREAIFMLSYGVIKAHGERDYSVLEKLGVSIEDATMLANRGLSVSPSESDIIAKDRTSCCEFSATVGV